MVLLPFSENFRLMCWSRAMSRGMDLLFHRRLSHRALRSRISPKNIAPLSFAQAAKTGPMATAHTHPPQSYSGGRRGFTMISSRMKSAREDIRSMEQQRHCMPFYWQIFPPPIQTSHMKVFKLEERKFWSEGVQLGHTIPHQSLHYRERNVLINHAKTVQRSNLPKSSHLFSALSYFITRAFSMTGP